MISVIDEPRFDYDLESNYINEDMSNKLFCTFATEGSLDNVLSEIQERYNVIYNKIFVLYSKSQNEFICTYNVDFGNVGAFLDNTILVHRKKESNPLYTINALDTSFKVNWNDYRNCILLTKGPDLKRVNTKLHKIIEI